MITLVFHPLAAALFDVQDVNFPSMIIANSTVVVGLNNDTNFQDLTCMFLSRVFVSKLT